MMWTQQNMVRKNSCWLFQKLSNRCFQHWKEWWNEHVHTEGTYSEMD